MSIRRTTLSSASVRYFLEQRGLKPHKRLGQNFLISEKVLTELAHAAELSKDDIVLEVGAGIGTITLEVAQRAGKVIAVEKDRALIPILIQTTELCKNVEIRQGDILKLPLGSIPCGTHYKLIGNIPYYLTAPLIRKFLEIDNPPKLIVLMVQKEVAQRICAKPPDMSILAVSVQVYAKPKIITYAPRSSFWPQPKVDSAILRIVPTDKNAEVNLSEFFRIVKAGFLSPRKQLLNNLSRGLDMSRDKTREWLLSSLIAPQRRAETLSIEEWTRLTSLIPK